MVKLWLKYNIPKCGNFDKIIEHNTWMHLESKIAINAEYITYNVTYHKYLSL